jgi:hypothetical protein
VLHELARRAFRLADIGRRNSQNILLRLPLRGLRYAIERRRKARMMIAAGGAEISSSRTSAQPFCRQP